MNEDTDFPQRTRNFPSHFRHIMSSSRTPIGLVEIATKGSASFRKLNAHLLEAGRANRSVIEKAQGEAPKRIRQNSAGLNKTEQAFSGHLRQSAMANDETAVTVLPPQAITLRLGNGVRYTPDFVTVEDEPLEDAAGYAQTLRAYEVKGFMRDDAAVKLKVAASAYPWIKFHLVTKAGNGWDIQEVLP